MGQRKRMITEVKVKEIDYGARYLYPSRRIEIKTTNNSIITPTRAATSYEFGQKTKVPADMPIKNQTTIDVENLNYTRLTKFLQTNDYYTKLMRKIELNNRLSQYSDLNLVLMRPTISPKRDKKTREILQESPMTLLTNNHSLRDRFIRFIIKIQQDLGLNPITIPFLDLSIQTYKEVTVQIAKSLERINRQPLFFLDMKYAEFEAALDWIVNELQSNAVGLYHKAHRTVPLNFDVLSRYVDKDVAFISAQVRRYDPSHEDISTMHYLPFLGNDLYAVATPQPFGVRETDSGIGVKDRLRSIRLFDKDSLCLKRIRGASSIIDELEYEYRSDSSITDILRNYHEANTDADKLTVLRAFSKISELKDSSSEFINLQEYVKQGSTRDYVQEKQVLQKTLQDVAGPQAKFNHI
ncbi:MAG: hypothetical protein NWE88_11980 [Candidatus Bathyarchaeota archaeon]|nr:hypothetical protein [Candidatus Bathyarchaeota archaeon]